MAGTVRIGTSGYVYPHWRGVYYPPDLPQREWFARYARDFDTVEINNTFYRLPEAGVFERWGQAAPSGFLYAFKASRYLTHLKKLKDPGAPLDKLISRARQAGGSLGPFLYQLPPHWRVNLERLQIFLQVLPGDLIHVLEFRDDSWFCPEVKDLLSRFGAAFCIHDHPDVEACPSWGTADTIYLRLHGPGEVAYAGSYPEAFLQQTAERITAWQKEGRTVFVYFNNDLGGHAVCNALALKHLLAR